MPPVAVSKVPKKNTALVFSAVWIMTRFLYMPCADLGDFPVHYIEFDRSVLEILERRFDIGQEFTRYFFGGVVFALCHTVYLGSMAISKELLRYGL